MTFFFYKHYKMDIWDFHFLPLKFEKWGGGEKLTLKSKLFEVFRKPGYLHIFQLPVPVVIQCTQFQVDSSFLPPPPLQMECCLFLSPNHAKL